MYSNNSFGSFYPVNSSIHKLNPIIKYICMFLMFIILITNNILYIHGFMFALLIAMILLSYVPIKFYFKSFYSLRYILIFLFLVLYIFGASVSLIITLLLKVIIFVEYINIFNYTTSISEMNYGLEKILNTFNFMNLHLSKFVNKVTSFIRYIPLLTTTEYKILKSQASRGIDYNHSNILGITYARMKIISNKFEIASITKKEIEKVSELRLFNTKKHRTNLRTNKVKAYDILFLAFHILLIVAYVMEFDLI